MQLSYLEIKEIQDALAFRVAYLNTYKKPVSSMLDSLLTMFTKEKIEYEAAMDDHIMEDAIEMKRDEDAERKAHEEGYASAKDYEESNS